MAKKPRKPPAKAVERPSAPSGYVRNLDLPVGPVRPPAGSLLKKPKGKA